MTAGTTPPRSPIAFQAGAVGHRDLVGSDPARIAAAATQLFRALAEAAIAVHREDQRSSAPLYAPDAPRLRCVNGLAAGADAILAEAALAEGWEVVAVLPFAVAEYELDFRPGPELERFRALLARCVAVCELDGGRGQGDEPYAAVGDLVVEQADVIVAIWDGQSARGPGGTGEVIEAALARGTPIALLAMTGDAAPSWRGVTSGDAASCVRAALTPPAAAADFLRAYYADTSAGAHWASEATRGFERLVALGARDDAPPATNTDARSPATGAEAELARQFTAADRLAIAYAARYRAAGLMRYGLVLPASLGALLASSSERWLQVGGNLAQFVILVVIVAFSARAWREPAHQRFIAYRALAEGLRNARLLAAFGPVDARALLANGRDEAEDWTAWRLRSVLRAIGVCTLRCNAASLAAATDFARALAIDQIAFLLGRARRFDTIAGRLSRLGVGLSMAGIAFTGARAGLVAGEVGENAMRWFNEAALILPALAPVFLGLLSFNEYKGIATRYRAIATQLQSLVGALEAAAPRRLAALKVARRIADVMAEEGAEWRQSIKAHSISAY